MKNETICEVADKDESEGSNIFQRRQSQQIKILNRCLLGMFQWHTEQQYIDIEPVLMHEKTVLKKLAPSNKLTTLIITLISRFLFTVPTDSSIKIDMQ